MNDPVRHDPLDYVDRLARRARQEAAPARDVSGAVLRRLEAPAATLRNPMFIIAAGYAAVAAAMMVYGWNVVQAIQDPIADVFRIAAGMVS